MSLRPLLLVLSLLLSLMPAVSPAADDLLLFSDRPAPGLRLQVADMEASLPFDGTAVTVPKPARPMVPLSVVQARPQDGGVALAWQEAWLAALRIEAETPLDLRPWLAEGAVEFEVLATSLARSGLSVAMDCGPDCGRKINHVRASRALEGRGWQTLSFPLQCFQRDGADFSRVKRPFVLESSGFGELVLRRVRLVRRPTVAPVRCPDWRTQSVTPVPLEEVWALDWWLPRHVQKLELVKDRLAAGRGPQLVFIGDSITHAWDDVAQALFEQHYGRFDAIGLGFGGDKTENVLWRLQQGALDGMRPRVIVLMIGTNNTGDRQEDPTTTAAGIRRLLDEIQVRQPQARVLLLGIFPRDPKPDSRLRRLNARVNEIIAGFADGRRVHYLDIGARLANPDGTLSPEILPDWLHLSVAGYAIWAEAMNPTLLRLLAEP